MRKFFAQAYLWILLIVLYAPIGFIAIYSFTEAKAFGSWTGFSTKLYRNLLTGNIAGGHGLVAAIENTLTNSLPLIIAFKMLVAAVQVIYLTFSTTNTGLSPACVITFHC